VIAAPLRGSLIFRSAIQLTKGVGGTNMVAVAAGTISSISPVLPFGPAKVTVAANAGVTTSRSALRVPNGVGDVSGVENIFGVGVGGFSSSCGSVGAILLFTKKTIAMIAEKRAMKNNALLRMRVPRSFSSPKMAVRRDLFARHNSVVYQNSPNAERM